MSCNGCRALRRGCGEACVLRPCLEWIESPQAQSNATVFVSKFFGRTDLLAFISAVSLDKRTSLFQSLLFEACGRTVNPVGGAVGLLSTGNWGICQAAVETVLSGGTLRPLIGFFPPEVEESSSDVHRASTWAVVNRQCSKFKPFILNSDGAIDSPPSDLQMYQAKSGSGMGNHTTGERWLWDTTSLLSSDHASSGVSIGFSFDCLENMAAAKKPKLLNLFV